jgi:hypothetical protein
MEERLRKNKLREFLLVHSVCFLGWDAVNRGIVLLNKSPIHPPVKSALFGNGAGNGSASAATCQDTLKRAEARAPPAAHI